MPPTGYDAKPMDTTSIQTILGEILGHLGLSFEKIDCRAEEDMMRVEITSNDASRIIGWHGETLNSIQHILKSIIRQKDNLDRSPFLLLDVDGYRKSQEDKVCKIAAQKADFVRKTKNRVALAPMSPYFRRVVHLFVANNPDMQDITTESAGQGDYRQIVLRLKKNTASTGSDELSPVIEEDDGLENLDI